MSSLVSPPPPEHSGARAEARLRSVVVIAVLLMAGACRVDATVETRVEGRGGVVRAAVELDRAAVAVLGTREVLDGVQVGDLRDAGWTVGPVRGTQGGGARLAVSKRFEEPDDLALVVAELGGEEGPLRDFRFVRRRDFASTRYRVTGRADLRNGTAAVAFANAGGLATRLAEAGVDPGRVEELLTTRAQEGFHLAVAADLPGGDRVVRPVAYGEVVELEAASKTAERTRPVLLVLALVLALAAGVTLVRSRSPQR